MYKKCLILPFRKIARELVSKEYFSIFIKSKSSFSPLKKQFEYNLAPFPSFYSGVWPNSNLH